MTKKSNIGFLISCVICFFSCFEAVRAQNVQNTSGNTNSIVSLDSEVDSSTLGLNLVIKLGSYTGRNNNNLPVTMRYSSKVWNIRFQGSWTDVSQSRTYSYTEPFYAQNTAAGWTNSLVPPRFDYEYTKNFGEYGTAVDLDNPRLFNYDDPYFVVPRLRIRTFDGISREFRRGDWICEFHYGRTNNPNIWVGDFYSVDGSKLRYNTTDRTLYMPDGSRYIHEPNGISFDKFVDRNGNISTFSVNAWTDTLGRQIPLPPNIPANEQDINYSLPGMNNNPINYVFKWKNLSTVLTQTQSLRYPGDCSQMSQLLSPSLFQGDEVDGYVCGGDQVFNPIVLNEIVLPDGTSYKFTYNVWGEIDKVIYPTGAYERFNYGTINGTSWSGYPYTLANRGVVDKWTSTDGNALNENHWQYDGSTSGKTITIKPDLTKTEKFFKVQAIDSPFGFEDKSTGSLIEEKNYSATGDLLRRSLTSYQITGMTGNIPPINAYPVPQANRNSRPIRNIDIMFENGAMAALATIRETAYDANSDPQYFASLNVKQVKNYAYKVLDLNTAKFGTGDQIAALFSTADLATISEIEYLYDTNYKLRGINGLPILSKVKDKSGSLVSQSQIVYDDTAILWEGSATNWENPATIYRGNATTTKLWVNTTNTWIETHSQFDQFGNLRKETDANGNISETEYDAIYHSFPVKAKTPIPDPSGINGSNTSLETTMTYDFTTGLPLTTTDANLQTTIFQYNDAFLRPTKTISPNGKETVVEYGLGINQETRYVKVRTQIDYLVWKEVCSWFDGFGRTIKSRNTDSNGDVFVESEYDSIGRLKRSTNPYRIGETKVWTTTNYDASGRPYEVITADGAKVTTMYGLAISGTHIGTVLTITDQAANQRRSITNSLGQLIRIDEPNNVGQLGDLSNPNQHTDYTYDTLSNLIAVVQGQQMRTFAYDSLSRLKSANTPEGGLIQYAYDNNGNLTNKIDARQIATNYVYDALNRIKTRSYSNEPVGQLTPNVEYTYDKLINAKGKLIKVTNGLSATEYTSFDVNGRVLTHKQRTDNNDYTTNYTYNLGGVLIEETYPSGRVVKNTLDLDGDLQQVQSKKVNDTFRNFVNAFTYTSAGAVSSMRLGNGKFENTAFNSRLQTTQIGLGASATSQNLLKLNFDYGIANNNGNVKSQTITTPTFGVNQGFTATQIYTYDSLNRIKQATDTVTNQSNQGWQQTFVYDRYGNRTFDETNTTTLSKNCGTEPYKVVCTGDVPKFNPSANVSDNKLVGTTYDNVGNTKIDANGRVFTYDAENKQTKVVNAQGVIVGEYFYDGDGKRVKKVVPSSSEVTIFIYDAGGKMVAEYSTITASQSEAKISYLTNDHLGSPRITTDAIGSVISRRDFMPFGEEIPRANYGNDSVRRKFTTYERDNETELDFAQARMYSSKLGRFSSPDPIYLSAKQVVNPQIWNLYAYVSNNPLNSTDPTGMTIIELGRPDTDIDADLSEVNKKLKDKNLSKEEKKKLEKKKEELQTEKVANAWARNLITRLAAMGIPVSISELVISTDPKNDFGPGSAFANAGGKAPDSISGMAFFTLRGYSDKVYINTSTSLTREIINNPLDDDLQLFAISIYFHERSHAHDVRDRKSTQITNEMSERQALMVQKQLLQIWLKPKAPNDSKITGTKFKDAERGKKFIAIIDEELEKLKKGN
jgi:RHS repeat-associated protein